MPRYLFIVLLLAGCATQEQLQARQQAYANSLYAQCSAYGFARGTPEFSQCVMRLDMANRQSQGAASQQMIDSGLGTMQRAQPPQPAPQNQIHCMPDRIGGTICR